MTDSYIAPTREDGKFLDKETERDLATRWQKHGDIEAREQLVMAFQPLARGIARSYAAIHGHDFEALLSDAQIGLLKAADKFDLDRVSEHTGLPVRFSTCATWWINAEVRLTCSKPEAGLTPGKSNAARPNLTSLDETIDIDDDDTDCTRHDLVADPEALSEDDLLAVIDNDKMRGAILGLDLTLRDRRIAEASLDGLSPKAIAAELGISRQRVDQIWDGIVDRVSALSSTKPAPAKWYLWHDRPPAELPWCKFSHLNQVDPDWFKAQQWPPASSRIERHVDIVAGPALMPGVLSRWGYAHTSSSTGLQRRKVKGRLRIFVPATPAATRSRPENKRPRAMPPPRGHEASKALLASLKDEIAAFNTAKAAFVREKCWSWKKPALTEMDVIEAYKQIPVAAIEPALAKLSAVDRGLIVKKFGQPMTIPALARFRQHSYAKTLPALYRAVKRLQRAAELINHDNVVMIFTPVKRRAAA